MPCDNILNVITRSYVCMSGLFCFVWKLFILNLCAATVT